MSFFARMIINYINLFNKIRKSEKFGPFWRSQWEIHKGNDPKVHYV